MGLFHLSYAERRARPLRRRRTNMRRPVAEAERFKNPCVRARFLFLGCQVRLVDMPTLYVFFLLSQPLKKLPEFASGVLRRATARAAGIFQQKNTRRPKRIPAISLSPRYPHLMHLKHEYAVSFPSSSVRV